MMSHRLILADQAEEDLVDIWLYIASGSPQAADHFIAFLHENVRLSAIRQRLAGRGMN